jgi:hypothetical protein
MHKFAQPLRDVIMLLVFFIREEGRQRNRKQEREKAQNA